MSLNSISDTPVVNVMDRILSFWNQHGGKDGFVVFFEVDPAQPVLRHEAPEEENVPFKELRFGISTIHYFGAASYLCHPVNLVSPGIRVNLPVSLYFLNTQGEELKVLNPTLEMILVESEDEEIPTCVVATLFMPLGEHQGGELCLPLNADMLHKSMTESLDQFNKHLEDQKGNAH